MERTLTGRIPKWNVVEPNKNGVDSQRNGINTLRTEITSVTLYIARVHLFSTAIVDDKKVLKIQKKKKNCVEISSKFTLSSSGQLKAGLYYPCSICFSILD